jgi:hypothetical protein
VVEGTFEERVEELGGDTPIHDAGVTQRLEDEAERAQEAAEDAAKHAEDAAENAVVAADDVAGAAPMGA